LLKSVAKLRKYFCNSNGILSIPNYIKRKMGEL